MSQQFANRSVLVTGSASGIGRAIAIAFAKEGASLALADVQDDGNAQTMAEVEALGAKAITLTCDVSQEEQVEEMVKQAIAGLGSLDIAVNNAAIEHIPAPIWHQDASTYDKVFDVNVKGVWLSMKHELAAMVPAKSGCIINISAIAESLGSPFLQTYVASKHAVLGLTKSVALEAIGNNVRVNAIAPGPTRTEMFANLAKSQPELYETMKAAMPIGEIAEPSDIAQAALVLASDQSRFVVGQSYRVDGGYSLAAGMSAYPTAE